MPKKVWIEELQRKLQQRQQMKGVQATEGSMWKAAMAECSSPKKIFCSQSKKLCYLRKTLEWGSSIGEVKLPGGSNRPAVPPSIFNVPLSSLPTKKFPPRPAKTEDKQLRYFLQNDTIASFDSFKPDRELKKKYKIW